MTKAPGHVLYQQLDALRDPRWLALRPVVLDRDDNPGMYAFVHVVTPHALFELSYEHERYYVTVYSDATFSRYAGIDEVLAALGAGAGQDPTDTSFDAAMARIYRVADEVGKMPAAAREGLWEGVLYDPSKQPPQGPAIGCHWAAETESGVPELGSLGGRHYSVHIVAKVLGLPFAAPLDCPDRRQDTALMLRLVKTLKGMSQAEVDAVWAKCAAMEAAGSNGS